jgi:hypothetical protein
MSSNPMKYIVKVSLEDGRKWSEDFAKQRYARRYVDMILSDYKEYYQQIELFKREKLISTWFNEDEDEDFLEDEDADEPYYCNDCDGEFKELVQSSGRCFKCFLEFLKQNPDFKLKF